MSKHTPGKIKVAEFPVDEPGRNHDRYLYSVDNQTCIGKVHRLDEYTALPPDPEGKANAARLVLCWNSHDDLKKTLADIVAEWDENEIGQIDGDFIDAAREAIARATP